MLASDFSIFGIIGATYLQHLVMVDFANSDAIGDILDSV
jgi:hypothetical protein